MLKKISLLGAALLAIALMSGCESRKIMAEEVLQVPTAAKLYTKQNIWYEKPGDIYCLNYQKGEILPFGTEVINIDISNDSVSFTEKKSGRQFRIFFRKEMMMIPVEDYVKNLLTTKTAEELAQAAKSKPANFEKIHRGIVEEGMSRKEVLLAYGYPVALRTPSLTEDTWIFWDDELQSKRVVFKGDKVIQILKLD